jgi:hypothetical protein
MMSGQMTRAVHPSMGFKPSSVFLVLITLACSTATSPPSGVTLLVTNANCTADQCTPLQVLGFPENQPHTPGGYWSIDLGFVTGPSGCLTLPASETFRVINGGTGSTTDYTWTTGDRISLGTVNATSRIQAYPTTNAFVPANARGWSVTLPVGVSISPTQACAQ